MAVEMLSWKFGNYMYIQFFNGLGYIDSFSIIVSISTSLNIHNQWVFLKHEYL